MEEFPSRFAFESVNVFSTKDGLKAEVDQLRTEIENGSVKIADYLNR